MLVDGKAPVRFVKTERPTDATTVCESPALAFRCEVQSVRRSILLGLANDDEDDDDHHYSLWSGGSKKKAAHTVRYSIV